MWDPYTKSWRTDTDVHEYRTEWRPYNKYLSPGATGRGVLKNYVCPSDKNNATPMTNTNTQQPETEETYSSWQSNGNSFSINWYWSEAYGGVYNLDDQGGRPGMSSLGTKMLRKKEGGRASEFVLFYENCMNAYMYEARPPGHPQPSTLKLGKGWHRKFSYYQMGFYDGHGEFRFYDTRYTRHQGATTWPDDPLPYGRPPGSVIGG